MFLITDIVLSLDWLSYGLDRAVAEAVSRWVSTAAARVQTRV
jgi:hypothetical protein